MFIHHKKSNGPKIRFFFPFYGLKQPDFLMFEDIMKHTMTKFISNLPALFVYKFVLERDYSGRGGRGGLDLES